MVSRQRLRARAQPLTASPLATSELEESLIALRLEPAGHRPFRLPREPARWANAALAETEKLVPGFGARALVRLLTLPDRTYELSTQAQSRRLAVLAAVIDRNDEVVVLRAIIEADVADNVPIDGGDVAIAGARVEDDRSRELLVEIAEALTPGSLAARDPDGVPPAALMVGDLPAGGSNALRRRLWAHGVRLDAVLEAPYRRYEEVRRRLETFGGQLLLISVPGSREAIGRLAAVASPGPRPMMLLGEDDLEYILLEVDERLDEHRVDLPEVPPGDAVDQKTWATVTEFVKTLRGDHFEVTKRCLKKLPTCPYPDPSRMRDQLDALARTATSVVSCK